MIQRAGRGGAGGIRRADLVVVALLSLLWVGTFAVVDPRGNFPLNDDWSYARAVLSLLEDGQFRPTGWTSMTLVAQAVWGGLFCLPTGFSFTALRLSSLVLGLLGVIATYFLLRVTKAPRPVCALGALTVAVNPLYLQMAATFMTDVPFTACAVAATLLFSRALRDDSRITLLAATVAASVATLVRQLGVFLPLPFAAAILVRRGVGLRHLARALLPAIAVFGVLATFEHWLKTSVGLPALYGSKIEQAVHVVRSQEVAALAATFCSRYFLASLYLGLFLSPLLAVSVPRQAMGLRGKSRVAFLLLFCGLLATSAACLASRRLTLPALNNVLYDFGLGPVTLSDVIIARLPHVATAPRWLWVAVTSLAACGQAALLASLALTGARLCRSCGAGDGRRPALHLLGSFLAFFALLGGVHLFDRYLLPLLPLGAAAAACGPRWRPAEGWRARDWLAAPLLCLFLAFSLAGVHDYFALNRSRWRAIATLTERDGVSPGMIDGGFEFNGWHLYDPNYRRQEGKSWWWVADDVYRLALGPLPGYETVAQYPFARWLHRDIAHVLVLRRTPGR